MRAHSLLLAGILIATAACSRDEAAAVPQADPTQLTSSGEVALADGGSMSFNITSDRYKQWDSARRAFPKSLITRYGQVLQPRSPTERSINNAVALLESNAQARRAIEGAGLSVRGFVEITVALEQQMMLASTGRTEPAPMPMPETYPMTMDSGYYPMPAPVPPPQPYTPMPITPLPQPYTPVTPVPVTPPPVPVTPYPARDSVRRDTIVPAPMPTPTPAPLPAPTPAPRPDSVVPRRDTPTVRRDTIVAPTPPRRDTVRDTARVMRVPPDSASRG